MKAATGELNMTVIIILAVAIMSAFFYTVIWPLIKDNQNAIIRCREAICADANTVDSNGRVCCSLEGEASNCDLRCTWKG